MNQFLSTMTYLAVNDDLPCGKMSGSGVLDSQPPSYTFTFKLSTFEHKKILKNKNNI